MYDNYMKAAAYVLLRNAGGHICDQVVDEDSTTIAQTDAIRLLAQKRRELAADLFDECGDDHAISLVAHRVREREELRGRPGESFYALTFEG